MDMNADNEADRVDLVTKARKLGGNDLEHRGVDNRAHMTAALKKAGLAPPQGLDDKSDDYIRAMFDLAHIDVEKKEKRQDGEPIDIVARAREEMIRRSQNAWREPLSFSVAPADVQKEEPPQVVREDAGVDPSQRARAQQYADSANAWKQPLRYTKRNVK